MVHLSVFSVELTGHMEVPVILPVTQVTPIINLLSLSASLELQQVKSGKVILRQIYYHHHKPSFNQKAPSSSQPDSPIRMLVIY